MSRYRLFALLLVCLALPLSLAACGGDDDDDGGGDEELITEAIETSATSTDPAHCTEVQTLAFTEQSELATGEEAIGSCEEDAVDDDDPADSVDVSEVVVDGTAATADVTFNGGPGDGSTVTISLVKEGDQWKLDQITDVPDLDLEGFQAAAIENIESNEEIPPEQAACLVEGINATTEDVVVSLLLSGDPAERDAIFAGC